MRARRLAPRAHVARKANSASTGPPARAGSETPGWRGKLSHVARSGGTWLGNPSAGAGDRVTVGPWPLHLAGVPVPVCRRPLRSRHALAGRPLRSRHALAGRPLRSRHPLAGRGGERCRRNPGGMFPAPPRVPVRGTVSPAAAAPPVRRCLYATGASTRSFSTDTHSVVTPAGVSGSSGPWVTNRRVSDGLTANTASESRYSLSTSKTCVVSVR
jgi:hypothetical protein